MQHILETVSQNGFVFLGIMSEELICNTQRQSGLLVCHAIPRYRYSDCW